MSRRPTDIHRGDEAAASVVRLRRLLGMIEDAAPVHVSPEAMEAAGFSLERREPDPFLGRRILAHIAEREARRRARSGRP